MYATGAGRVASDGTGRNGLFTTHLLNNLKITGLDVNEIFRRTMNDVSRASNGDQRPALYTDFAEIAYLGQGPSVGSAQAIGLIGQIDTAVIQSHENLGGLYGYHNSLPMNTLLRVTNLANGNTVEIRVIGRVSPGKDQELFITEEVARNLGNNIPNRFPIKTEFIYR